MQASGRSDAGDRIADGAAASRWGPRLLVVVLRERNVDVAADSRFDPIVSEVAANTLAGSRPRRRRARRRRRVHDIVLVHPARRRPVLNRCARARAASLPGRSRTGRDRRDPRRGDHARRSTERSVAVRGPHRHDRGRAATLRSSHRARLPKRERERPRTPERGRSRQPAARPSFVITRLCTQAQQHPDSSQALIDPRRIAVAGQSDGGETAFAVAYDRRSSTAGSGRR